MRLSLASCQLSSTLPSMNYIYALFIYFPNYIFDVILPGLFSQVTFPPVKNIIHFSTSFGEDVGMNCGAGLDSGDCVEMSMCG